MNKKTELVFVPSVGISHLELAPTIEFAKRLIIASDDSFSIAVLIMPNPFTAQISSFTESSLIPAGIQFIYLPPSDLPPPPPDTQPGVPYISLIVESHKPSVKTAITQLINAHHSLAGLVVDLFSTTMIDIGDEFNIPSYIYFPSGLAMLGLLLHVPILDAEITTESYSGELLFFLPSFKNQLPSRVLPFRLLNKQSQDYSWTIKTARKFKEAKGLIVNSFSELEPHAIESFSSYGIPKLYKVGPLLNLPVGNERLSGSDRKENSNNTKRVIEWLDNQPESSVIFLCFERRRTFITLLQVKEIAIGLEKSGHRFIWSVYQPAKTEFETPSDYINLEEVLPEGFLERTKGKGLVCGWIPQEEVLAHKATGGFVSQCRWNLTLESLWFGVPILAWPLDDEQKLNAFLLVRELGLAVEMRKESDDDNGVIWGAEEIESGVRRLMDSDEGQVIRKKVGEMSEICRKAVKEGGSSFSSLGCLIDELNGTPRRM